MSKPKSMWSAEKSRKICKRIIVETMLVLQTPAHFGSGDSDEAIDMPLLTDALEPQHPLLPGASLAGALRAYLQAWVAGHRQPEQPNQRDTSPVALLFGGSKGDDAGEQSALIIEDALGIVGSAIETRTSVRLDGKTRTAKDRTLFNTELWPAGTRFPLRFELLITADKDEEQLISALATALHGLEAREITLGARKRRGYGAVTVEGWRARLYDLSVAADLIAWLKHGADNLTTPAHATIVAALGTVHLAAQRTQFALDATFALDGSLLIRDGSPTTFTTPNGDVMLGPDMVHIHSYHPDTDKPQPVVPGTSVAGALRARATRIARLLGDDKTAKQFVYDLFGPDMDDKAVAHPAGSTIRIAESFVTSGVENGRVQNRVAIDRFTGGARDTALFNEQPLFSKGEPCIRIEATIVHTGADARFNAQVGMLLLLLKDLWLGELPLGGEVSVGRGRLTGYRAVMRLAQGDETSEYEIVQGADGLTVADAAAKPLESYVADLHTYLSVKEKSA